MSSKTLICTLLIGSLAACASTGHTAKTLAQAKSVPPECLATTGSRVASKPANCGNQGRTWTQDELRRTGEIDAAGGLSVLDPSVSVSHH